MVGDDGGQASEVALPVSFFPISGAEDAIETNQGGRGLLVTPCVSASIEVDLFEQKIIEKSTKFAHPCRCCCRTSRTNSVHGLEQAPRAYGSFCHQAGMYTDFSVPLACILPPRRM
jgi:hypothetical protein